MPLCCPRRLPHALALPAWAVATLLCTGVLPPVVHAKSPASHPVVTCHINYGGADELLILPESRDPYVPAAKDIGSRFQFRAFIENVGGVPPQVKVYTYSRREGGVALVHQGGWDFSSGMTLPGRYGFTGLQRVYESYQDGELQYWCEASGQ